MSDEEILNYQLIFGADASELNGIPPTFEEINAAMDAVAASGDDIAAAMDAAGAAGAAAGTEIEEGMAVASEATQAAVMSTDEMIATAEDLGIATEAETNALLTEAAAFYVAEEAAQQAGSEGGGMGKVGQMMDRMLIRMTLMQLGLSAVMNLMKNDEGFQAFQEAITKSGEGALGFTDNAMRGVAGMMAAFTDFSDWYTSNWAAMWEKSGDAVNAFTKTQAAQNALVEEGLISHTTAMAKIMEEGANTQEQLLGADTAAKIKIVQDEYAKEEAAALQNLNAQMVILTDKFKSQQITQQQYSVEMQNLIQKAQDTELQIRQQGADKVLLLQRQALLDKIKVQDDEEKADETHDASMSKDAVAFYDKLAADTQAGYQLRQASIDAAQAIELNDAQKAATEQRAILQNELNAKMISQESYDQKVTALDTTTEDKRVQIYQQAAQKREAISKAAGQQIADDEAVVADSIVSSVKTQIQAGNDFATALKNTAADVIQTTADESAKIIMAQGLVMAAKAAAKAYDDAGGGYPGIAAGAAAGGIVLAEYTGWAVAAEALGTGLSTAMGGGKATSGGGSSDSSSSTSTAAAATTSTASSVPTPVAAGSASGGTVTPLTVNLVLNGQVLATQMTNLIATGQVRVVANA